jgi:hypothetical protein
LFGYACIEVAPCKQAASVTSISGILIFLNVALFLVFVGIVYGAFLVNTASSLVSFGSLVSK